MFPEWDKMKIGWMNCIFGFETLQDSLLRTDEADFRYTWGDISWQPEGKGVMLLALKTWIVLILMSCT